MPPRSKQSQRQQVEWCRCSRCQCYICTKDVDLHAECCSVEVPFDCANFTTDGFKHSFIENKTLVAFLDVEKGPKESSNKDKTPLKDGTIEPRISTRSHADSHVYINPATMSLCGFTFLRPVIVDGSTVLMSVPDTRLPLATVIVTGMSAKMELGKKAGQAVSVAGFVGPDLAATQVQVLPVAKKPCLKDGDFWSFCSRSMVGRYFCVGGHMKVTYLGSVCDLKIVQIVVENGEIVRLSDTESFATKALTSVDCGAHADATATDELCDKLSSCHVVPATGPNDTVQHRRFFKIVNGTTVELAKSYLPADRSVASQATITLEDVGGLETQKAFLINLVDGMMNHSKTDLTTCYGINIPRAVLLYGPSGSGKTMLIKALARSMKLHLVNIGGSAILSPYVGEAEKRLQQLFGEARLNAPSLILFDEIDALCPRRRSANNEVEQRTTSCLCAQIDSILTDDCQVFVVAVTRRRDDVNQMLTVSTRFGVELEISAPNSAQRAAILERQLKLLPHMLSAAEVTEAASRAHGFIGSDLAAVCREARQHAVSCQRPDKVLTIDDLSHGFKVVQPSAMKELAIEKPNVRWADIGGMHELKLRLEQTIVWPIRHPEVFVRLGCRPPRGHLLYGPPGCSKTMIAKALATESDLNFIAVKGPELLSKWVGESERAVRELFRKARAASPAIIFFDEIDALAVERGSHGGGAGDVVDRVMAQLLTEIDGVVELKDISILAATNRPDLIDKALKRPGRLDREIYVGLPDDDARREIFEILFRKTPVADDINIDELVSRTQRYSGAEVSAVNVVHEAAMCSLSEGISSGNVSLFVHARHFDVALNGVKARISDSELQFYTNYAKQRSHHLQIS